VQTSSACRDLLLIQLLNKQQILGMRSLSALLPRFTLIWSFELTFRPRCVESIHRWNCSQFISAKNLPSPRFFVLRSTNIYKLSGCIEYFDVPMFVRYFDRVSILRLVLYVLRRIIGLVLLCVILFFYCHIYVRCLH